MSLLVKSLPVTLVVLLLVPPLQVAQAACPHLRRQRELWGGGGGGNGGGGGGGNGSGNGGGNGGGGEASAIIQQLFDNHLKMDRSVTQNNDGTILTSTTSNDASVASLLQTHVEMMQDRAEEHRQVRPWDPFFVELFDRHDEVEMEVTNLSNGVQVSLSASTDCGQALIEDHTAVVSLFVETGREEGSKEHAVPQACRGDEQGEDDAVCSLLFDPDCK